LEDDVSSQENLKLLLKLQVEYKWFCSEHIKIYNHEWDFFSEMSQDKIEEFIHSDITWHKPTSKLGSKG
jgi:hypothetical protein